ncbi:MAG: hypothetical protein M3Z25_13775 [Actinomycetota bacterium]|nr:hypothetical protein [Actinomycetota bacterium]
MEVARSESWVSQVERDVLPVERLSVLQILADALGASVGQLRPDAVPAPGLSDDAAVDELGALRLAMTRMPGVTRSAINRIMPWIRLKPTADHSRTQVSGTA